jgi:uncharacterized membrane protein
MRKSKLNKRKKKARIKPATIIISLIILALILRLSFLGKGSIRADEGATLDLAAADWNTYLSDAHHDVHPPLYYRFLHIFTGIGDSEFTLRLSSVIPSVLSVLLLYLLGRKLFDEKTALIAAGILAISQYHIRYAQFLRMYSILVLLALLSTYYYWILITEKPRFRTKIFYILSSTALIYTHYYGFLILLFQGLFLIIDKKARKRFIPHIPLFAIIILLFIPWAPIIKDQLLTETDLYTSFIDQPLTLSFTTISSYNIFAQGGLFIYQFLIGYLKAAMNAPFIIITILSITIILAASRQLIKERKAKQQALLFLSLTIIGSIGIVLLIQYFKLVLVMPYSRYLMIVSPLFLILIAYGISRYAKRIFITLLAIWIILNLITLYAYYATDYDRENWKKISSQIAVDCANIDCINEQVTTVLLYPASYAYNLHHYYPGTITLIPTNEQFRQEMNLADIYSRVKIPKSTPDFCNFTHDLPTTFTVISALETTPALEDCFKEYQKVSATKNTYGDIWGRPTTDITITSFSRQTNSP